MDVMIETPADYPFQEGPPRVIHSQILLGYKSAKLFAVGSEGLQTLGQIGDDFASVPGDMLLIN
jgi:hypothetical protein